MLCFFWLDVNVCIAFRNCVCVGCLFLLFRRCFKQQSNREQEEEKKQRTENDKTDKTPTHTRTVCWHKQPFRPKTVVDGNKEQQCDSTQSVSFHQRQHIIHRIEWIVESETERKNAVLSLPTTTHGNIVVSFLSSELKQMTFYSLAFGVTRRVHISFLPRSFNVHRERELFLRMYVCWA